MRKYELWPRNEKIVTIFHFESFMLCVFFFRESFPLGSLLFAAQSGFSNMRLSQDKYLVARTRKKKRRKCETNARILCADWKFPYAYTEKYHIWGAAAMVGKIYAGRKKAQRSKKARNYLKSIIVLCRDKNHTLLVHQFLRRRKKRNAFLFSGTPLVNMYDSRRRSAY